MAHPLIEEHLPLLAEYMRYLDALDGRTVTVTTKKDEPEEELYRRFVAYLNRSGSLKISSKAIV